MTAYGRSSGSTPIGRWVVELHSVNRKYLDLSINLPKDFLLFDIEIRKWLSQYIQRGQVTIKVGFQQEVASDDLLKMQVKQLLPMKQLFEKIATELSLAQEAITLPFLLEQMQGVYGTGVVSKEDVVRKGLFEALADACKQFMQMKETEGRSLAADIEGHLQKFEQHMQKIEPLSSNAVEKYKKKLHEKIDELKVMQPDDHDRIMREVMIYAERIDISEELARVKSHIGQFRGLLSSKESSVGKTMDFLLQEMNREVNTLSSKSDDIEISKHAILMKSELEKIREQVQNVE